MGFSLFEQVFKKLLSQKLNKIAQKEVTEPDAFG